MTFSTVADHILAGEPAGLAPLLEVCDPLRAWHDEVLPAARIAIERYTRAEAILKQIFSNAPLAVKFSLEAVNKGMETSQSEGLALEASFFGLCAGTEDKGEGTQAFLQKRAAQFRGR